MTPTRRRRSLRLRSWTRIFWVEAGRGLLRYRLRSTLTTLGIAVGIAAVVLVVAIGQTGRERAENALQDLGDNLVWIEAGSRNVGGVRTGTHGTTSLTIDDAEAVRREVPLIRRLSPQIDGTLHPINGSRNWTTRFRGESPEYLAIRGGKSFEEPLSVRRTLTKRRARSCSARQYVGSCSGPTIRLDERFGRRGNCSKSSGF